MVTNSFGNRNFMQPMGRLSMHSKCLDCFHFPFVPNMFPMGSHQVPKMFRRLLIRSPRVFPITPRFNPIYFAQSPPFLTFIAGPKGEALHRSIESSILGSLHSFNFFFVMGPIKLAHCDKRKLDLRGIPN